VSVVTNVLSGGQAELAGVEVGCTVVGVNGERFISHAHTIATLQHGKRPIKMRLRFPDRPSL
jgi:predicted metalloprotease with PDZ domain